MKDPKYQAKRSKEDIEQQKKLNIKDIDDWPNDKMYILNKEYFTKNDVFTTEEKEPFVEYMTSTLLMGFPFISNDERTKFSKA